MIMRRCNFNIKFIVDNRLYLYPSIIKSDNMYLSDSNFMPMLKHTLTVKLPLTAVTKELKVEQSFLKWGQKWQIQGRDYTEDGLLILTMERISTSHLDDKVNEIADRFDGDEDKLNGNIEPILPFGDEPIEPDPEEPEEPTKPDIKYIVEITKQYQGDTEYQLSSNNWQTYTIKKLVDNEEVDGDFNFVLSEDIEGLTLTKESDNTCKLSTVVIYGKYNTNLIVTDIDTNEIVTEQNIFIKGR